MARSRKSRKVKLPDETTAADARAFVLEYLANGENGTRAWLKLHPKAKTQSAAVSATRLLRKANVQALLHEERLARWKRLKMDADEALALISLPARFDIAVLFDDQDRLKPVRDWPLEARLCVKHLKRGKYGHEVTLHDALEARRLMAIEAGKLKANVNVDTNWDPIAYLAAKTDPKYASRE